MSTSPTLPAGFFITSINGQRCTAVPRASTTLTGALATQAAAQPPTTSTTPVATTAPANTVVAQTSSAVVVLASTLAALSPVTTSTTSTPIESITSAEASPASKGTTPTVSSVTSLPQAQSEVSTSLSPVFTILNGSGFTSSTKTSALPLATTTGATITSTEIAPSPSPNSGSKVSAGPVVGGVLGSMSFIALVAFLIWFFRRRRHRRDSLLTPLGSGQRNSFFTGGDEINEKGSKWKGELGSHTDRLRSAGAELKESLVGLGAALKSKVARDRSDTPSVNLNRGNSQFLDGPIPQHSRNNSAVSNHPRHVSLKERAMDWWERLGEKADFARLRQKGGDSEDPFTSARMKKAAMSNAPNFARLGDIDERELQLQAERRRRSSLPGGSLGLNFDASPKPSDPFADPTLPPAKRTPGYTNPFADPTNPFADPEGPTVPQPSAVRTNTYIADIRRSRGQSVDATTTSNNATSSMYRPPSTSRYPSTIAPSHDSYRDTVYSSFSANARKGKGRSDPFDLERPELWKPRVDSNEMYPPPLNPARNANAKAQGVLGMDVGGQPGKRVTYNSSKYSSGVSGLTEWGDPGPDVSPGSLSKENVLGNGVDIYHQQQSGDVSNYDVNRSSSNASSKGGVGKAM